MNSERRTVGQAVFDSSTLPAGLGDQGRFARFHAFFESVVCAVDVTRHPELPFAVDYRFGAVDRIRLTSFEGTISRINRGPISIARDSDDDFCLLVNKGSRLRSRQMGREHVVAGTASVLLTNGEPAELLMEGVAGWTGLALPRARLKSAVHGAENLIAQPLRSRPQVGSLLARYIEGVLALDADRLDSALQQHINTTIVDLLALLLGVQGDAAALAGARGLRAVRLQEILERIKTGFTNPEFSSEAVAARLGLSQRYVNMLLLESGQTFAERVLELRMQKARAMLADTKNDRLKVSEIALACGFGDVSYFNRRFRARFGCSPTQYRAGKSDETPK